MNNSKNKKSIFFIIPNIHNGGAEKVSINLAKGIAKKNFSVNIIYFKKNIYEEELEKNYNINFIYIKSKKLRYSIFEILKILKKNKPQFVFSSLSHVNIYLLFLKFFNLLKCKLILRESNLPLIQAKYSKISKLLNFSYKYLYKYSDLIICTSPLMIKQFNKSFNLSLHKLFLLHNPIDIDEIKKLSLPIKKNNNSYLNLVSVGRLNYQKNFSELVIFFSKRKNLNYKLYIIGEGKEKKNLQYLIDKNNLKDKVFLLGYLRNPYNIIANSNALISISLWEGMPNSILEALALGKKVIFFDRMKLFDSFHNISFKDLILVKDMKDFDLKIHDLFSKKNNINMGSNLPKNFYMNNSINEFIDIINKKV